MTESMLYKPVKALFEALDFEVKAEIGACDIVAMRENEIMAVELKQRLNLDVILQALDRQKIVDTVYIAVFESGVPKSKEKFKDTVHLLRRLEIGLVLVSEQAGEWQAFIHTDAIPFDRVLAKRTNKHKHLALKKEFERRYGDDNVGGTTRTKRMTAYRQDAIGFALMIAEGTCTVAEMRLKAPALEKKIDIMRKNFYGWFMRIDRGIYALTASGQHMVEALSEDKKTALLNRVIV